MQHQQYSQESFSQLASLILTSLMQGPKYIAELREAIEQTGDLLIEPGTLYRVVAHLEQRGWIEALETEGPLRPYRITAHGILALQHADASSQRELQREKCSPGLRRGKGTIMRLVMWILRLYPPAWRQRYEAEMVALLEQHTITFWTGIDLLIGALDARLDPHYRRARPHVPGHQLWNSWRLIAIASLFFWLNLVLWAGASDLGDNELSQLTQAAFPGPFGILSSMIFTLFWSLLFILIPVVKRIVAQSRKQWWNMLRLLPLTLLIFLTNLVHLPLSGWQHDVIWYVFTVDLALEGGALLFTMGRRWVERHNLLLPLLMTAGMVVMCIVDWIWTVAVWKLIPRAVLIDPTWQSELVQQLVLITLPTMLALFALVRSFLALRAMNAAPATPKQEPL